MSMGGETEARNRPSTMLTQLSGEVTTDRRHKQWRAISGQRRVGDGGSSQGGAGNALDETHSQNTDETHRTQIKHTKHSRSRETTSGNTQNKRRNTLA